MANYRPITNTSMAPEPVLEVSNMRINVIIYSFVESGNDGASGKKQQKRRMRFIYLREMAMGCRYPPQRQRRSIKRSSARSLSSSSLILLMLRQAAKWRAHVV